MPRMIIHKALVAIAHLLALMPTLINAASTSTPEWKLTDDYFSTTPSSFFQNFEWFTSPDPTNGLVTYVDQHTAETDKLVGFLPPVSSSPSSKFQVFMGLDRNADNTPKRNSVRIQSRKKFNPPFLMVADVSHIPTGPGTWPSMWLNGADGEWPASGEIDIIEEVSSFPGGPSVANAMTLHTTAGCALQSNHSGSAYQGVLRTQDCNVNNPNQDKNAGCQIQAPAGLPTFGTAFNAASGGTYVTEWTDQGINIWFFSAAAKDSKPASLNSASPDPSAFGKPMASFTGTGCDFKSHFKDMQIIWTNTLCGDWAGNTWNNTSGCQKETGFATCQQAVMSGKGLGEAYWTVGGLRVFGQ